MGKIAFLFSGQGAQYSGMGKSLFEKSAAAKEVFDFADMIRPGTTQQCFTASKDELSLTSNTQPCLYCVDLAAAEALRSNGVIPDAVAGFSLGEIAALTFSGVFSKQNGFQFVCRRAHYMSEATAKTGGSMAAILKLSNNQVNSIAKNYDKVFPVNYNCPGQIAVAGDKLQLADFCNECKENGGKAIPLAVSGAFHSPFMNSASQKLAAELENISVIPPVIPIFSNYTADLYPNSINEIKQNIYMQVNHPVRWQEILEKMWNDGFTTFIEVGAGKTLSGLAKKTLSEAKVYHVENAQSLENTLAACKEE